MFYRLSSIGSSDKEIELAISKSKTLQSLKKTFLVINYLIK